MKILQKALIGILLSFHLIGNAQWLSENDLYVYCCLECPTELKVVVIDTMIHIDYSQVNIYSIDVTYLDYASNPIESVRYHARQPQRFNIKSLKNYIENEYGWIQFDILYIDNSSITYILPTKKSYVPW